FNWNTAIAIDPFDSNTVYYGSQFLHKSTNRGDDWTIISPDLTTNNPAWQHQSKSGGLTFDATGAENFTTIITIAPSAVARGVIWAGTDDGRVQLTRDGGGSWTSLDANFKGVPKNSWVAHIEPSKFDAGEAFAIFDNHRRSDWTPYVFRTTDFGKSWTNLATKDVRGYALVLEQDPVKSDLLFLGTEFGLWVSTDGGKQWMQWTHGFPTVSAMAMTVHPRDHDLVIATHGRSAYILDDVRPFRNLTREILAKPIHLFEIPDALQHTVAQTGGERFPGDSEFRGENEPYGAMLTFVLNAADLPHPKEALERERKEKERAAKQRPRIATTGIPDEPKDVPEEQLPDVESAKTEGREKGPQAEITVYDTTGTKIRAFKSPVTRGVNRATWDLRRDAFKQPPRDEPRWWGEPTGPEILPGSYKVTVKYKDQEASGLVNVLPDPRRAIADADRKAKWDALILIGALNDRAVTAIERILRTKGDIDVVLGRLKTTGGTPPQTKDDPEKAALQKSAAALQRRLDAAERLFRVPPKTKGIVDDSNMALSRIEYAESSLSSTWDAPTSAQLAYVARAEATLASAEAELAKVYSEDVARFREAVRAAKIDLFTD
ncbi:MAG: WD40/YVTN/BNR-like repeat-containing protein, partial [Thermoanaerobaculia bacterium]